MTRYLVTGASGLLGLNFALHHCKKVEVFGVVHRHNLHGVPFQIVQLDLSREGAGAKLVEELKPDVVVHCAAMANVDECETNPALAKRINSDLPGELSGAARKTGAAMVHISTDAVFDGLRGNYCETDDPNPLSVYAHSKLIGEQEALSANPDVLIARVNFYGWSLSGQRSLAEWFYYNLAAGKQVKGFTDVFFCPLFVMDLADILMEMTVLKLSGIYHVVSSEGLSKYDFGMAIARRFGFNKNLISPASWQEAGLKAARSPNLTLNVDKLKKALVEEIPGQLKGLDGFYQLWRSGYKDQIKQFTSSDKLIHPA